MDPNMTEKLLTGMLNTKQTKLIDVNINIGNKCANVYGNYL